MRGLVDAPQETALRIGNEEIAVLVERQAARPGEERGIGDASITDEGAAAGDSRDDVSRGIGAADASVRAIFDEEIAGRIERQRVRLLDAGLRRDTAVA